MNAYSTKTNAKTANKTTTPFCKVCMDAGKGPEIYKSHYVKNDTGNVICPTLLALECRFCFKTGHTVKYCKTLEKKKQMDAKQINKTVRPQPKTTPAATPVSKNMFDCLYSDDEHETETETQIAVDCDFPSLNSETNVVVQSHVESEKTWATIAAQEAPQKIPEVKPIATMVPVKEILSEPKVERTINLNFGFGSCRMKNWADWTDSDEE